MNWCRLPFVSHDWKLENKSFSFHSGLVVFKEQCYQCGKTERNHRDERRT